MNKTTKAKKLFKKIVKYKAYNKNITKQIKEFKKRNNKKIKELQDELMTVVVGMDTEEYDDFNNWTSDINQS